MTATTVTRRPDAGTPVPDSTAQHRNPTAILAIILISYFMILRDQKLKA